MLSDLLHERFVAGLFTHVASQFKVHETIFLHRWNPVKEFILSILIIFEVLAFLSLSQFRVLYTLNNSEYLSLVSWSSEEMRLNSAVFMSKSVTCGDSYTNMKTFSLLKCYWLVRYSQLDVQPATKRGQNRFPIWFRFIDVRSLYHQRSHCSRAGFETC